MWAVGTFLALVTIALLVALLLVNLDAVKWENLLSSELIEQVVLVIGITVALTTLIFLLAIGGASLGWTGFADKTLWEWLQLLGALAIPLVLAIAGFWFTSQQEARQQRIETQRAEAEGELAEQRAQDEALQAYLDQMGTLLLAENGLRESKEGSEERSLARARTITVLGRLDPVRRLAVMRFLEETELVQRVEGRAPIIELTTANLSQTSLRFDSLHGANLSQAALNDAHLNSTNLIDANLKYARLIDTHLRWADLSDANLFYADLSNADLSNANLAYANLRGGANLNGANLSTAGLPYADLSNADLSSADLSGANLRHANLLDADLSSADLSSADLRGTEGVTREKLAQQAKSLRGATMPHGTIYPGRYAAREFFQPAVSFEVGEGWEFVGPETPDELPIQTGPKGGQLIFTNPLYVFDPTNLSQPKEVPAPESAEEWVSWWQSHPNLDTSKPVPASVGGASGKLIDVTASSMPENYPRKVCGEEPCVPLYPTSGSAILSYEGYKDRFIIVDVGDETVNIDAAAPTDKFEEFLPKAQKVLDSVEWKGG